MKQLEVGAVGLAVLGEMERAADEKVKAARIAQNGTRLSLVIGAALGWMGLPTTPGRHLGSVSRTS